MWDSLACDYLSIMASSVLSERVFSSAGIMLGKHCNHLQGGIVEALQFLKCLLHQDLIFCEVCAVEEKESILDENLKSGDNNAKSDHAEGSSSWEESIIVDNIIESDMEVL